MQGQKLAKGTAVKARKKALSLVLQRIEAHFGDHHIVRIEDTAHTLHTNSAIAWAPTMPVGLSWLI